MSKGKRRIGVRSIDKIGNSISHEMELYSAEVESPEKYIHRYIDLIQEKFVGVSFEIFSISKKLNKYGDELSFDVYVKGKITVEKKFYSDNIVPDSFHPSRFFWAFGTMKPDCFNGELPDVRETESDSLYSATFRTTLEFTIRQFKKIYESMELETEIHTLQMELNEKLASYRNDFEIFLYNKMSKSRDMDDLRTLEKRSRKLTTDIEKMIQLQTRCIKEEAKLEFNHLQTLPECVNKLLDTTEYENLRGNMCNINELKYEISEKKINIDDSFKDIFKKCKFFYRKFASHFI